ncbi:MAG TPA: calcium-binding protein [Solirubrobacterales bacterium]|jgi:hypothetical protein|nr:calcium-binding protein [Solirubrobacterales bacterium]
MNLQVKVALAACGCFLATAALAGAAGGGKGPFGEYCRYVEAGPPGPRGNKLVVFNRSGGIRIRRKGREIRVVNLFMGRCTGGQPTVDNLDRIVLRVTKKPPESEPVRIDLRGGPFQPGATPEPSRDQIEILADGFALEVEGEKGADAMVARTLGGGHIGVDLDGAAHNQRRDYEIVVPRSPYALKLIGGRGRDRLDTRGITNMGDHRQRHVIRLYGKHGSDLILGGPRDEWRIEDGAGDDLVRTGGGDDEVLLGRGHDTVFGGRGRDSLYFAVYERFAGLDPTDMSDRVFGGPGADRLSDENRHRDVLRCGSGIDEFETEPRDRPGADCERLVHP